MIAIFICLVVVVIAGAIAFNLADNYDRVVATCFTMVITTAIMAALFCPIAQLTGGFLPDYSEGYREGYVTKISQKGIIWKTFEGQIQVGTGSQAALQAPFDFSTDDPDMAEFVEGYLGDRVRIKYSQWFIMPFSKGESGYTIIEILPISD